MPVGFLEMQALIGVPNAEAEWSMNMKEEYSSRPVISFDYCSERVFVENGI